MNDAAHPLRIAVFISGHGFGHMTRTSAVLGALAAQRPLRLTLFSAAPRALWPDAVATDRWHPIACDPGVVQADDLHVDLDATQRAVRAWLERAPSTSAKCIEVLTAAGGVDCVVGDVPALAFEVAAALGVPSIAIANFSWDWIYAGMGLDQAASRARDAYAHASLLLELAPATPMPAFPRRVEIGTIGRRSEQAVDATRRALGLGVRDRCVLLSLRQPALDRVTLPRPQAGLRFLTPARRASERADVIVIPKDVAYLDALAAADVVLSKTGYSIIGDCAANSGRLLWVERSGFPEDPYLASWLVRRPWAAATSVDALMRGSRDDVLWSLLERPRASFDVGASLARAAAEIASLARQ